MARSLKRVLLIGGPALVGLLNLFHPVHFAAAGLSHAIAHHVGWWTTLHVLNLAAFSLMGAAAWTLIGGRPGIAAGMSRAALAVFLPTYLAFDTLMGIATGVLVRHAGAQPPEQRAALDPAIDLLWAGPLSTALASVGSIAWSVATVTAAVSFARGERPLRTLAVGLAASAVTGWGASTQSFGRPEWWAAVGVVGAAGLALSRPGPATAMLILSGVFFGTTHVVPYGPLGAAFFLGAAILLSRERAVGAPVPSTP